eukprot:GHUV01007418.1.p1 GENE.GHUV01007418.1~~GHUV01007418.1.p1  ORF type:complete len:125 (+),score=12.59 GHUV01007418.1:949-1323(+)
MHHLLQVVPSAACRVLLRAGIHCDNLLTPGLLYWRCMRLAISGYLCGVMSTGWVHCRRVFCFASSYHHGPSWDAAAANTTWHSVPPCVVFGRLMVDRVNFCHNKHRKIVQNVCVASWQCVWIVQ